MGGSKVWKNVGRVVAGVATGGASEIVNEVSSGGIYGKKSTAAHALGLSGNDDKGGATTQTTETKDGDNVEKTEGASGTAEGGEDVYSSGAMALKLKKKKSTLIGSGDSTFTSTLGG